MKLIDITSQKFARWTVVSRAPNRSRKNGEKTSISVYWNCVCDCGTKRALASGELRRGKSLSCGCRAPGRAITHGYAGHGKRGRSEYRAWSNAKARCYRTTDHNFPHYGARGITMCDRWRDSFENFIADMGDCPPGLTLDRIDVNGNYEPGNCRWATTMQQMRNRTITLFVEHDGTRITLKEFSDLMGVRYHALHKNMRENNRTAQEAATYMLARRERAKNPELAERRRQRQEIAARAGQIVKSHYAWP